jgi:hypothetical protein
VPYLDSGVPEMDYIRPSERSAPQIQQRESEEQENLDLPSAS